MVVLGRVAVSYERDTPVAPPPALAEATQLVPGPREVDTRLPGKGNSNPRVEGTTVQGYLAHKKLPTPPGPP